MNTKDKILYWIKGSNERGWEVIDTFEQKGGKNKHNLKGQSADLIYYLNGSLEICNGFQYNDVIQTIIDYDTELTLPEKRKMLSWEDISKTDGYILMPDRVEKRPYDYKISTSFATEQQAKSAQAAAMISQIREQGKEVYGEIVDCRDIAYVILCDDIGVFVDKWYVSGGLLRFETKEQAQLFLENNRELVEDYLKTF